MLLVFGAGLVFVINNLRYSQKMGIVLIMINEQLNVEALLQRLGQRLKAARLERNESQELFAQRLGLTRQSYSKMEQGFPGTPIGTWLAASSLLDRLDGWQGVLAPSEDLFAQAIQEKSQRQRASARLKVKK